MNEAGRRILIIIVIAFVVLIGFLLLRGGPNGNKPGLPKRPNILTDYINSDSRVQLTIDGRINSNEMHRVIRISVAQNERIINVFQGYEQNVIINKRYDNNHNAYNAFMHAIYLGGFAKPHRTPLPNEQGVCPLGFRYVYQLFNDGKEIQRTWAGSCNVGSFGGNISLNNALFQRQIPDYGVLTNRVDL